MTTKIAIFSQCYALGMEYKKQISRSFELSRNTVRRYVRLFQKCGIPIKELASMPSSRIQEMFSEGVSRSQIPSQRQLELEALPPEYSARLSRRGVTVKSLYKEYHKTRPNGYKHASFGNYLYALPDGDSCRGILSIMPMTKYTLTLPVTSLKRPSTMKTVNAVALKCLLSILPCSHYTYCEAVWSQSKQDLIKACETHFIFTAVFRWQSYRTPSSSSPQQPQRSGINEEFAAFSEHYGCTVYPARVRHPKDKALVENAVKLLYRQYMQMSKSLCSTLWNL